MLLTDLALTIDLMFPGETPKTYLLLQDSNIPSGDVAPEVKP
jgi:hypothetical protein